MPLPTLEEQAETQRAQIEQAIEAIRDAHQDTPFLSFVAFGITADGRIFQSFTMVSQQQMLVGGALSRLTFTAWRCAETMDAQLKQHEDEVTETAIRAVMPRPQVCPKAHLIGGCDYPDCDCVEDRKPS